MGLHSYDIVPSKTCDSLIELYENDSQHHERVENESRPTFTQLNLNKYHGNVIPSLFQLFSKTLDVYKEDVPPAEYLPELQFIEEFRIKKYEVGGIDRFDTHVDVGDHMSAKRCLAMLFYLNDVDEGGHTVFPLLETSIQPKKGRVIVFPPTWEYPHSGEPPISNSKYIMSTYLHYG